MSTDWTTYDSAVGTAFVAKKTAMLNQMNVDIPAIEADVAAIEADVLALQTGSSFTGTSVTSETIGTGSKTFTIVETNRSWGIGSELRITDDANMANYMTGNVTSYSGTTLIIDVDSTGGSGTKTAWTITLAVELSIPSDRSLPAIDKEINSNTIVSAFVYDTSKDFNPNWINETQHTSWYNETLNTATRGATRAFPRIALIVVEADTVTIYDATKADCPMWMVFIVGSAYYIGGSSSTSSAFMLNGILYVGKNSNSAYQIDFVNDSNITMISTGFRYLSNPTSLRNAASAYTTDSSLSLSSNNVNTLAVTQDSSGNNIVYVGSDGGLDRIAADGSVSSALNTAGDDSCNFVAIIGNYVWFEMGGAETLLFSQLVADELVDVNASSNIDLKYAGSGSYNTNKSPIHHAGVTSTIQAITHNAIATNRGLTQILPNPSSWGHGLLCTTTDTFCSGYQYGDVRGAWLGSGESGTLSGAGLITGDDSDFTGSIGNWVDDSGGGGSSAWNVGGYVVLVNTTQQGAIKLSKSTVIGHTYVISSEEVGGSSGFGIQVGTSDGGSQLGILSVSASSVGTMSFTATTTTTYFRCYKGAVGTTTVDNISVIQADPDLSYNNNGLTTVGTITKSAVNTGCDLMAYSGFSSSNYLYQPYNSDLDFGTGDFYIMGWVNVGSTTTNQRIVCRSAYSGAWIGGGHIHIKCDPTGIIQVQLSDDDFVSQDSFVSTKLIEAVGWTKTTILRTGNTVLIYINGELDSTHALSNATGTLNNASATLFVGNRQDLNSPADSTSLSLLRIGAGAPTAEQIQYIYEQEKPLFNENAEFKTPALDCKSADYDESNNLLTVGTASGLVRKSGLINIESETGDASVIATGSDIILQGNN